MRSVMTHQFSQVPSVKIQRSSFDRSHGHKSTFNAGYLIPVLLDEVLPGDTFNVEMTGFARLATPIFPIMDNLFIDSFFFFVPNRLVWSNWKKFNGEQDNPGDSISYLVPTCTTGATGSVTGDLRDYMGIPTGTAGAITFNALHQRAYNLIWNEWFRDENLQNSVTVDKGDGPDTLANYVLLQRGKRHDYFTSCLPWPQKGATAVSLPLGTTAPVKSDASSINWRGATGSMVTLTSTGVSGTAVNLGGTTTSGNMNFGAAGTTTTGLYTDLSAATAATINQIRQAFQIQKLLERDARGGTRYTEIVRAHFGVVSPDARLQRSEFLGGGRSNVNISPIAQTSATATQPTPQGNLAAMGTCLMNGNRHGFTKSFTEHGVIIGLVCVHADLTYQQGVERMFKRQTRYDFYWPAFAHIGEQSVLNSEIYAQGTGNDSLTFGYQERYAEYRYKPSRLSGLFRSYAPSTLDAWHLSEKFTALPTLGASFIVTNPPMTRIKAVTTQPDFIFDSYFNMRCARPMPVYGVPGDMDRF